MTETSSSAIATIADIDSLVANDASNLPYESKVKVNPFEMRFLELSLPHRRLLRLKFLYHTHPTVDKRFQEHREIHLLDAHSVTPSPVHLRAYEKAFSEVNRANASCFGGGRVQRFLDLGCSPGGFSTWLFKSNWAAQGVGITLPDEDAKYPMQIDPVIASPDRYRVQYDNIITLVMKSVDLDANPVIALREDDQHAESNSYDLVVAGAFPTLEGHIPWWHRVQMILSQLLIIMSNVARDGVCVIIINMKPFLWLVDVIGLLRQTFGTITTTKGGKFHALRTSCYLVCRDFHAADEEVQRVTARIRHVLRHLDTVSKARADAARAGESEEDGSSERTSDSPEDVPLMSGESASEVFEAQHRFVLDLFEPLWVTQYDAIHADFAKVLSEQSGDGKGTRNEGHGTVQGMDSTRFEAVLTPPPSPVRRRSYHSSVSTAMHFSPPNAGVSRPTFTSTEGRGAPSNDSSVLEHDHPTTPASPSKWRLLQRRTTMTDTSDWRRRTARSAATDKYYKDDTASEGTFGRERSQSAADASAWWRSK